MGPKCIQHLYGCKWPASNEHFIVIWPEFLQDLFDPEWPVLAECFIGIFAWPKVTNFCSSLHNLFTVFEIGFIQFLTILRPCKNLQYSFLAWFNNIGAKFGVNSCYNLIKMNANQTRFKVGKLADKLRVVT